MPFSAMANFYLNTSPHQKSEHISLRARKQFARLLFAIAVLIFHSISIAQKCDVLPVERSIPDGKGCLTVWWPKGFDAEGLDPTIKVDNRVLVVLLHGDSAGGLAQRHIDRWARAAKILTEPTQRTIFLVRPGYSSPIGDSSGWANQRDDDYTAENVQRVATALKNLKAHYKASKLLLIGHSGGAAIGALLLGRHPDALDGAVLLGCPCDVPNWRQHRSIQRGRQTPWPNSLNPMDAIAQIPTSKVVLAITGSMDDNTLPKFAQSWIDAARARGVDAKFILAIDQDHSNIILWPELRQHIKQTINHLTERSP